MTPAELARLDEWRQKIAADRPAPSAGLLAALRPLITTALPRAQQTAPAAQAGAAMTARTGPDQGPGKQER
jgi:hypothetical protein